MLQDDIPAATGQEKKKRDEIITVNENDTSMPELVLMNRLCIDQGLFEEGPHRRGLVESYNAVVRSHLLQRAQHRRLVSAYTRAHMRSHPASIRPHPAHIQAYRSINRQSHAKNDVIRGVTEDDGIRTNTFRQLFIVLARSMMRQGEGVRNLQHTVKVQPEQESVHD